MSFFNVFGGEGSTSKDASLVDKLKAIGGSSERSTSGVNIAATAKRLKVNPRTVRGWLNEGKNPSPKSQKRVTTMARNAARTKSGRKAAVDRARAKGAFSGVTSVHITGEQGPNRSGKDYVRERTIAIDRLTDADLERMQEAYIDGGDPGIDEELTDLASARYLRDWGVSKYGDSHGNPWLEWH